MHLQPGEREIIIHNLHTNEQDTLASEVGLKEQRLEDYIVYALVDFDDIAESKRLTDYLRYETKSSTPVNA